MWYDSFKTCFLIIHPNDILENLDEKEDLRTTVEKTLGDKFPEKLLSQVYYPADSKERVGERVYSKAPNRGIC